MKLSKDIKNDEFIFGDFDGDGVPNADDTYPLDPSKRKQVNEELRLTNELFMINLYRNMHTPLIYYLPMMLSSQVGIPKSKISGRIKDEISIIDKLRKKYITSLKDVAGFRIIADDKENLLEMKHKIEKFLVNNTEKYSEKNFYRSQKEGNKCYRGIHFIATFNTLNIEIQLRTKRVDKIANEYHKIYKMDSGVFSEENDTFCRLMNIADKADNGDPKAIKDWNKLRKITKDLFVNPNQIILSYDRIDDERKNNLTSPLGKKTD